MKEVFILANVCEYKLIVAGKKNACYAFCASMPQYEDDEYMYGEGTDDEFKIFFHGTCKWSIDAYAKEWTGPCPVDLPADYKKAELYVLDHDFWDYTLQDKSRMFGVEVMCNSADRDECAWQGYKHFINGEICSLDEIPNDIRIDYVDESNLSDEILDSPNDTDAILNFIQHLQDAAELANKLKALNEALTDLLGDED